MIRFVGPEGGEKNKGCKVKQGQGVRGRYVEGVLNPLLCRCLAGQTFLRSVPQFLYQESREEARQLTVITPAAPLTESHVTPVSAEASHAVLSLHNLLHDVGIGK